MARLRILDGDGIERIVDVRDGRVRIGRGRDNDVVLPDPQKGVSRVHAELRHENGRYVVVDLQSQNGTWVNGRQVDRSEVPLGAELAIGAYRLTLLNDRPAPVRETRRAATSDPLDDIRPTERYDPPLAPRAPAPVEQKVPRSIIAVAFALVIVIGLVAGVWVSGSRNGARTPSSAPTSGDTPAAAATVPSASPASPSDRPAEPVDLPADSPTKRSADRPSVAVPPAGDQPRVTRRPGETTEAWRSRAAALETRYGYSKAALDRGDFAAAAGGFEAILLEEPGFLDAPRLLVQAQSGLRASARSLYQAGRKLDDAGDWMGALQKYEQARQVHAGIPGLTQSLERVRQKLRSAGTAAFRQARELENSGRSQEALREYEKALQWLPTDDPNWHVARAKVQQLKRN